MTYGRKLDIALERSQGRIQHDLPLGTLSGCGYGFRGSTRSAVARAPGRPGRDRTRVKRQCDNRNEPRGRRSGRRGVRYASPGGTSEPHRDRCTYTLGRRPARCPAARHSSGHGTPFIAKYGARGPSEIDVSPATLVRRSGITAADGGQRHGAERARYTPQPLQPIGCRRRSRGGTIAFDRRARPARPAAWPTCAAYGSHPPQPDAAARASQILLDPTACTGQTAIARRGQDVVCRGAARNGR